MTIQAAAIILSFCAAAGAQTQASSMAGKTAQGPSPVAAGEVLFDSLNAGSSPGVSKSHSSTVLSIAASQTRPQSSGARAARAVRAASIRKGDAPASEPAQKNGRGAVPALLQLKKELARLNLDLAKTLEASAMAEDLAHDYRGGAPEVRGRAAERAAELKARIARTQKLYRTLALASYGQMLQELSDLKSRRKSALAAIQAAPDLAHEYRLTGGADEAAARNREEAGRLQTLIDASKRKIAEIKKAGPSFLEIRRRVDSFLKAVRRSLGD
jgi:hypothetical protein